MAYETGDAVRHPAGRAARGRLRHRSTPRRRGNCSSATPWCRASGRPSTSSSTATAQLLDDVEELEHRARRRDILVDDEALFEFYDERVAPEVVSARHFDTWWKKARRNEPGPAGLHGRDRRQRRAGGGTRRRLPRRLAPGRVCSSPRPTSSSPAPRTTASPCAFRWHCWPRSAPGRVRLAGSRHARRTGHRADQDAAEDAAPQRRSGPGLRRAALAVNDPARRTAAHRRWRASCPGSAGVPIAPSDFDLTALPDHLRMTFAAVGRGRARSSAGARISTRCANRALAPGPRSAVAKAASMRSVRPRRCGPRRHSARSNRR